MKAVLVIDVPDEHRDKNLVVYQWNGELNLGYINKFGAFIEIKNLSMENVRKYHYLKIKPMPQKINDPDDDLSISRGWNACINEITGETE